jgi:hypothetical protein
VSAHHASAFAAHRHRARCLPGLPYLNAIQRQTRRPITCGRGRPPRRLLAWRAGCRAGLEVRLRVPKAGGAAHAPAFLKLPKLAFGKQVCKRNDDVVPSVLKGGPARVDRISRGVALDQWPAASRHNGPQLVFSGGSFLDHATSYGPRLSAVNYILWGGSFADRPHRRLLTRRPAFAIDRLVVRLGNRPRAGNTLGWSGSARRDALNDGRSRLAPDAKGERLGALGVPSGIGPH